LIEDAPNIAELITESLAGHNLINSNSGKENETLFENCVIDDFQFCVVH
jgi:hypothetical protein